MDTSRSLEKILEEFNRRLAILEARNGLGYKS